MRKEDPAELKHHTIIDPHKYSNSLANIILGGQDGLVNVLGIVLGVAAATNDPKIVVVAGLSATFAESISMGAVAFTSMLAETAHYESEKEREARHIEAVGPLTHSCGWPGQGHLRGRNR